MRSRGLWMLGLPVAASALLFIAASELRKPEEGKIPVVRANRESRPASSSSDVSGNRTPVFRNRSAFANPVRNVVVSPPVATDIATAVDMGHIQSTYQNYRTACLTQNEVLKQALFEVLRRDRKAAMECAREDADRATTESDQAVALRTLAELER